MRLARVLGIGVALVLLFFGVFIVQKGSQSSNGGEFRGRKIAFKKETTILGRGGTKLESNSSFESDTIRTAVSSANQFLASNPIYFPIKQYHQLAINARQSPLGTQVTYRVFQDDFELIGMQIDLIVGNSGRIRVVSNQYRPIEKVDTDPKSRLSLKEIIEGQEAFYKLPKGNQDSRLGEVAIWASPQSARAEMVYIVSLVDSRDKYKVPGQAVFSAATGQLLARHFPRIEFQK